MMDSFGSILEATPKIRTWIAAKQLPISELSYDREDREQTPSRLRMQLTIPRVRNLLQNHC